jgi:hypothetical protein
VAELFGPGGPSNAHIDALVEVSKGPLHMTAKQVIAAAHALAGPGRPGDLAAIRGRPYSPTSTATPADSRAGSRRPSAAAAGVGGAGAAPPGGGEPGVVELAYGAGGGPEERLTLAQFAARQEALKKHSRRFELLNEFWAGVLRHCTWRKPFLAAVEAASAFANVTAKLDDPSACRISPDALVTAFWSAVIVPEHMHLPVAFIDTQLRGLAEAFDGRASGTLDYRELFACISSYKVSLQAPLHKLLRAWYLCYDGDARGGLLPSEVRRMLTLLCTSDEERWAVLRHVDDALPRLIRLSLAASAGHRSLADHMAAYADAKRVSKRLGPAYLAGAVPPGEEPPAVPEGQLMWSPYDRAMAAAERSAPHVACDVLGAWVSSEGGREVRALLHSQRVLRTHALLRDVYLRQEADRRLASQAHRRDIELGKKATMHRRVVVAMAVLQRWSAWWQYNALLRQLGRRFAKGRALAVWRKWTRLDQQARGHALMADRYARFRFAKRYWDRVVLHTTIELAKTASGAARADGFREHGLSRKVWAAWREAARSGRAYRHWRARMLRRHLRSWGGYSHEMVLAKAAEGSSKAAQAATRVDLAAVYQRIEAEAEAAAAADLAARHAREMARMAEEARRAEEAATWTASRNAALRAREAKRMRVAQAEAGRAWRAKLLAGEEEAWEAAWQRKVRGGRGGEAGCVREPQASLSVGPLPTLPVRGPVLSLHSTLTLLLSLCLPPAPASPSPFALARRRSTRPWPRRRRKQRCGWPTRTTRQPCRRWRRRQRGC